MRSFTYQARPGLMMLVFCCLLVACADWKGEAAKFPADNPASQFEPPVSAEPRLTRDEILADYNLALQKARQSRGGGEPALWTLRDEDTTIHFFGTVHLLPPDLQWRSEETLAAFDAADTIVFETDMDSPEAQRLIMTDFVSRGMFQDGRTLSGVLDAEAEAVVRQAFESVGVPLSAVESFEPWMASLNLSMMKLVSDGYDAEAGVESVLEAEGRAAGKAFAYLETIREQADALDLLSEQAQIEMLYNSALILDESTQLLNWMVEEWADGDAAGLAVLAATPDEAGLSRSLYEALLVRRNRKWVPRIEAMLDSPGTVFVAVGAAHLVGPDSVIAIMRAHGFEIEGPAEF